MRILVVHNRYQHAGGEDTVCDAEIALLRDAGHDVIPLIFDNHAIAGAIASARTALLTPYNPISRHQVTHILRKQRPDVVHVHNWFPIASPAIFDACFAFGTPVVWTLHNFRVTCLNGLLFRDGQICESCVGRLPLAGVRHRCYRSSLAGSAVVAATDALHAWRGTWTHKIDKLIALNDFARDKFIAAGLPADRLVVKPNFTGDPGRPPAGPRKGALFVGRLSNEKGVDVLIRAWNMLDMPLTIIGDGPEEQRLRAMAGSHIIFAGRLPPDTVAAQLKDAALLIVPSLWYENFPMVIVEAFAHGLPAIVSSGGALGRIVENNVTGWHFTMGDHQDLAQVVRTVTERPDWIAAAGSAARATYERMLTPGANLRQLEAIYTSLTSRSAQLN